MIKGIRKKVSIIGAGNVGSTLAYTLMLSGLCEELVLIDRNPTKAHGELLDISHGMPFGTPMHLVSGTYSDIEGSDVVVITAGVSIKQGQTRLDIVNTNTEIFKDILKQAEKYIGNAIFVIVSNPVDIMTYITLKLTGLPSGRVLGSGTVLDTARFRTIIGERLGTDPRNVHGYILGEHGDSEVAAWSSTKIAGLSLESFCEEISYDCKNLSREQIAQEVKSVGYEIFSAKGSTQYGVALSTKRIIESILKDEDSVLTVSSLLNQKYGLSDVCLSVPAIVNRKGVDRVLSLPLSHEELDQLHSSAKILQNIIAGINL